ncbi:MAG TPA: nuclear transport factor 2 family protein [Sphingomicrobium sp.]|nr:nuclear transport factor 2 family protein [Sphingomicrobium sp.]
MAADADALIETLEREWRDALCAKDIDRLRTLIHPDFRLIGSRSASVFTMTREQWLDAIQEREVVAIRLAIRDSAVLDQVMVGTIEARWSVSYLGRQIDDCVILTDVWVFDEGCWRVIRRHSSPVPDKECAV